MQTPFFVAPAHCRSCAGRSLARRSDSRIRHLFAEQGTHINLAAGQTSDSRIRPTRMMLPNGFYFVRLFFRIGIKLKHRSANKTRPSETFQTASNLCKRPFVAPTHCRSCAGRSLARRSDSRIRHLFAEQGTHINLAADQTSDSRIRPTRRVLPNGFYLVS